MPPPDPDAGYLWDMLKAARDVEQTVREVAREQYAQDRIRQLAVERAVEVLGEAARQVSGPFQQAHPEIPWRPIIAQRHVLAHDYGRIDHERLWEVAKVHVPALIATLTPLIPLLPPELP
jgi:uncharacterized protein with HEPN domain